MEIIPIYNQIWSKTADLSFSPYGKTVEKLQKPVFTDKHSFTGKTPFLLFFTYMGNGEIGRSVIFAKNTKNQDFRYFPTRAKNEKMGYFGKRAKMTKNGVYGEKGKNGDILEMGILGDGGEDPRNTHFGVYPEKAYFGVYAKNTLFWGHPLKW